MAIKGRKHCEILAQSESESPTPDEQQRKPGRIKRSKSRSILEGLRNYEVDVLRFITDANIPFTNNQGENELRMTKLQHKISRCFRSTEGPEKFCSIRGYLSNCRKHQCSASRALMSLFEGKLPVFFEDSAE